MSVFFLCVCLCMPGAGGEQKRTLDSLELDLQMIVGHHVVLGGIPVGSFA